MSLYIEPYGEHLFLVKGDAYPYKDELKKLGCRWNPDLKAWSFPKSKKDELEEFIENNGGSESNVKESKKGNKKTFTTNTNNVDFITKKDFLALLTRVERLEQLMGHSLGTNNKTLDIPKVFEVNKEELKKKINKKEDKKEENKTINKGENEKEENKKEEDEKPKRLLRKKKT
jgi:hypothetical protein